MKKCATVLFVFIILFALSESWAGEESTSALTWEIVKDDYRSFYLDGGTMLRLGAGIAGAAVLANTSMDRDIQDYYDDHIKGETTDELSKALKLPGEAYLTVPALIGVYLISRDSSFGEWAGRSLRALAVGAPAGLFLQRAIGSSRPDEGDSTWRPFKDNNGLSGHAFIGAVPFIVAAQMSGNVYAKGLFYGLSVLPGLSRINDDKHYFSQVALGWYLAYLSSRTIDKRVKQKDGFSVSVMPMRAGGAQVVVSGTF